MIQNGCKWYTRNGPIWYLQPRQIDILFLPDSLLHEPSGNLTVIASFDASPDPVVAKQHKRRNKIVEDSPKSRDSTRMITSSCAIALLEGAQILTHRLRVPLRPAGKLICCAATKHKRAVRRVTTRSILACPTAPTPRIW